MTCIHKQYRKYTTKQHIQNKKEEHNNVIVYFAPDFKCFCENEQPGQSSMYNPRAKLPQWHRLCNKKSQHGCHPSPAKADCHVLRNMVSPGNGQSPTA